MIHLMRAGRTSLHFQVLWCHLLSWKNHILRFQTFVLFWKMPFIKITLVSLIFTSCWDTSDSMVIWSWCNEMHRGLFYLNCNLLGIYSAMVHLFRAAGQNPHFQAIFWLSKYLSGNEHNHRKEACLVTSRISVNLESITVSSTCWGKIRTLLH